MSDAPALIAIVEDEPVTAALYAMVLEKAGYAAKSAPSSDELFALLAQENCALVLLDVYLPGIAEGEGGWDILRRLRERFSAAALPVIVLSSEMDAGVRAAMIELGASLYLTKPVAPADLIEAVEHCLSTQLPSLQR